MTTQARVAVLVSAIGLGTIGLAGQAGAPGRGATQAGQAPSSRFKAADHRDVSPALRDIRPVLPQRGSLHEMPRFRRARGARSRDPLVQNSPASPLVPAPWASFDGLSNVNSVLPPDTNGDVGPNHIVQWVNLSLAVYAKGSPTVPSTLLYGPAAGNTLWTGFGGPCESTNNGDPVVIYDHLADRWVMSQLSVPNNYFGLAIFPPFYECIAVSATPDPLGQYYRYQFSFDKLNDYPKLGVWSDGYYMGINQFTAPSLTFAGQGVVAFDRRAMLLGQPAGMIYFDLASVDMNLGGMLPADLDGPAPPPGSPNYFVEVDDDAWGYSPDQLQVWGFHADWATPSASSFQHVGSLPTAPFDSNLCDGAETCLPQPGTSATLDPISDRLMYRLQYRNFGTHESLVMNHTVDADGSNHAGIRWYEIRDPQNAPFIYQQGTYAPDADHRWMASAAMDSVGNLAIGFSVSGSTTFPSVRYAARLAADPLGVLAQGETTVVAGGGSQTHSSGRWGDYSMMTVDPSDDCTFWYMQEYYAATSSLNWRTRIGAFRLPSCTPPTSNLPPVSVAATAATATEAGPASGLFTVTRSGDTAAAVTISYTAGGSAVAGSDYVPLSGTVTIPAGATTATIAVVPINDTLVEPDESVTVTLTPGVDYSVGTPAVALITIVSDDLPPDLVIGALTVPAAGGAGSTIAITDTTTNQGGGPSDASTTSYYFAKNSFLESTSVVIGTRSVPALGPGASSTGSASVTIPATATVGTYFIIAKADGPDLLPETVETNNTRPAAISLGPDLIVSALTAPTSAAAGGAISVSDTTTNRGGDAANASRTSFYLSTNGLLDGSDIPLGNRNVPALAPGAASSAVTTVTIPASTGAGAYYVLAQADSANDVAEAQETNNIRLSSSVAIGADLVVASLTAPAAVGAGTVIVIADTITNQGAGPAAASSTNFYLSANFSLETTDPLLGSRLVGPLAAGASDSGTTSVTVPANTPTGTYYVIAQADANNEVAEARETNNTRSTTAVRVGPDLAMAWTSAPTVAGAGGPIVVGDTTKNQGGGPAGASATGYYLSTTALLSPSAVLLGSRAVPALAGGGTTNSGTAVVTLPSNVATGTYYVVASADVNNQVVETTETNNAGFGAVVRIGPDLAVSAFTAPSSKAAAGSTFNVSSTILNQGGGAASASTVKFYLSTNLSVDASDVLVGTQDIGALNASQSVSGSTAITIPSGTTAATYWLLAVADATGVVVETNETNNIRGLSIQVTAGAQ